MNSPHCVGVVVLKEKPSTEGREVRRNVRAKGVRRDEDIPRADARAGHQMMSG